MEKISVGGMTKVKVNGFDNLSLNIDQVLVG